MPDAKIQNGPLHRINCTLCMIQFEAFIEPFSSVIYTDIGTDYSYDI